MFDTKPYDDKFAQVIIHFEEETRKIRVGRAHPSILGDVQVEAYGTKLPLNQVANVTAPEAQLLLVTPFDPSNIHAVSDAIQADQTLGLNPSDDGHVVRVPIPPLSEERRKQLVKLVSEKVEEARIGLRTIRQEALKEARAKKTTKELSEDDVSRIQKAVDETVATKNQEIDSLFRKKQAEILTI